MKGEYEFRLYLEHCKNVGKTYTCFNLFKPKATMVLQDYSRGSGYGSISRTVEEIILAFNGGSQEYENI